jgi:lipoprotein-anchoring transpeptidase ErfK/SrfK
MTRSLFAVPLALGLAIPAAPVLAQSGSGLSPIYQDELPPAAGANDDRYMYRPQSKGSQRSPSNIPPHTNEADTNPLPDPGSVNPDAYGRYRDPAYRTDPNSYGSQQPGYPGNSNAVGRQERDYPINPNTYGRQQPTYPGNSNAVGRLERDYPINPNGSARQQPAYQPAPIDPLGIFRPPASIGNAPDATPQPVPPSATAALPPEDQPEVGPPQALPQHLKRQEVEFKSTEPPGTIIIDTDHTYLYLTLGNHKAMRYGIGVGREGFTWSGTERISKMKEWPDWFPPAEMIERQPYLPRMMAGGPGNPLGARALYLGHTLYRIHGTNQPSTIGKTVSSGCIRLLNEDIEDLFGRVKVGTRVVVLASVGPKTTAATGGSQPRGNAGLPPRR